MKALAARGYSWAQAHPAMISFALLALLGAVAFRGEETRDEGQATRRIVERVVVEVEHHRKPHPTAVAEGGDVSQTPTNPGHQPPGPSGGQPPNSGQEKPLSPPSGESPPVSESANNPGLVESVGPTVGGVVSGVTTPACEVAQHALPLGCP